MPQPLRDSLNQYLPKARIRLDGVVESADKNLYLPLIPKAATGQSGFGLRNIYPEDEPILFAFQNGWYYIRLSEQNGKKVLALPNTVPDEERKKLVLCKLPSDLIVPDNLYVSGSLKAITGDLNIPVLGDKAENARVSKKAAGHKGSKESSGAKPVDGDSKTAVSVTESGPLKSSQQEKPSGTSGSAVDGIIAVSSPQTGKIALLGPELEKLIDLPTEGTPGGMACAGGKLYVADQTKNRVLIINPKAREFSGQIDFPPGSGPKDVAALSSGTFLYVSESAANKIAVVEAATSKVLMHTVVPAGPTRLRLTPNEYTLLVLNMSAGKVTFLSTLNQKVIGTLQVGNMPSDIAISSDSRMAFVSNRQSNSVSVIDVTQRKVLKTMQTGNGPTGIALNTDGEKLFVANAKDNSVSVFDLKTMSKIKDISLPMDLEFPSDIILLPDGKRILVSSAATDTVGIIDAATLEFEKQQTLGCTSVDLIFVPVTN